MSYDQIIGIVGMPGSGKSVFDSIAKELGFTIIIMGDIIREEVNRRGLALSPNNIGKIMMEIRKEEGDAVVAKRCILKIKESKNRKIVIDGVRSLVEVEEFKRNFPEFELVYIQSSPEIRFQRITNRRRSDDSQSKSAFLERDNREFKVGIGSALAIANHIITNEGTLYQFRLKVKNFLKAISDESYSYNNRSGS